MTPQQSDGCVAAMSHARQQHLDPLGGTYSWVLSSSAAYLPTPGMLAKVNKA
jgi:hypothetical protein